MARVCAASEAWGGLRCDRRWEGRSGVGRRRLALAAAAGGSGMRAGERVGSGVDCGVGIRWEHRRELRLRLRSPERGSDWGRGGHRMRATVRRQWACDACAVARRSMELEARKRGSSVSDMKVGGPVGTGGH
nr:unnamed protein product [Digitaria exilis]